MKIVVTGSRHWINRQKIEQEIDKWAKIANDKGELLTIVHGNALGADSIVNDIALSNPLVYQVIPVRVTNEEWVNYGPSAGHRRNKNMINDHKPDFVLAFRSVGKSNGTDHCCNYARQQGYRVKLIYER